MSEARVLATRCAWAHGRQVSGQCAWQVRGRERSRSLDSILAEVRSHACAPLCRALHSSLLQLSLKGRARAAMRHPETFGGVVDIMNFVCVIQFSPATVCLEFEDMIVFRLERGSPFKT